jgi:hypothetical protein
MFSNEKLFFIGDKKQMIDLFFLCLKKIKFLITNSKKKNVLHRAAGFQN